MSRWIGQSLKRKCHHFVSYHFDNFRCSQCEFHQNDYISVSVYIYCLTRRKHDKARTKCILSSTQRNKRVIITPKRTNYAFITFSVCRDDSSDAIDYFTVPLYHHNCICLLLNCAGALSLAFEKRLKFPSVTCAQDASHVRNSPLYVFNRQSHNQRRSQLMFCLLLTWLQPVEIGTDRCHREVPSSSCKRIHAVRSTAYNISCPIIILILCNTVSPECDTESNGTDNTCFL